MARSLRGVALVALWAALALIYAACGHAQTLDNFGSAGGAGGCGQAPGPACSAGYKTLTFSTNAVTGSGWTSANVDTANTYNAGFQWYYYNFSASCSQSGSGTTLNGDGTVTIGYCSSASEATIATAGGIAGSPGFHGVAFGGGAYFEATIKYTQPSADGTAQAWWAEPIENLAQAGATYTCQWTGQTTGPPIYCHFAELDILESLGTTSHAHMYSGAPIDWWGQYNVTCTGYCSLGYPTISPSYVRQPAGSPAFTSYHRYGLLWIPATVSTKGSLTYFFDGVQQGPPITYSLYVAASDSPPPIGSTPWLFGVADVNHFVAILGVSSGETEQVQSVSVWQAGTSHNVSN